MANPFDQFDSGNPFDRFDAPKKSLKESNPAEYDPASPQYQAKYGPTAVGALENLAAGAGKFFVDAETGYGQRQLERAAVFDPSLRRQGISSLVTGQDNSAIGRIEQAVAERRATDAPLMDTKAGKAGYFGAGIASTAPLLAVPGANTVAGAALTGGIMGYNQPTAEGESPELNAALGAGLGAAGQKAGDVIGGYVGRKIAERTAAKAAERTANIVRDQTLGDARAAGYVIPPSHGSPTVLNRTLESVSGKAATQQAATVKNQAITNRLVREDLGMGPRTPITNKSLQNIRTLQGQVYKDIKDAGDIVADTQYFVELGQLTRSADEIASDFPGLNFSGSKEIKALEEGLKQEKFTANSAVEAIKGLRNEAAANLKWDVNDPAKRALGMAQKEAAGIMEDQVIRHLNSIGRTDLAQSFEKARQTIAKTYSVQAALNDSTGNVVATKLSAQLRKGKPLSGGIEKAAKFGQAFPKVAGEQLSSPGVSAVDAIVGTIGGTQINPGLFALPVARMAARGAVLSKPYQRAFALPSYMPRTRVLRGLGAGAEYLPATGVVTPAYFSQQEAF